MSFSKRSTKGRDDSDLYLECKAAFLTEFDDIDDKIRSRNQLISLLQLTGRNPTRGALSKHWTSTTDSLTFKTFVDICSKEPVTKPDDLMNAFKKIDINGDGYISLDELCRIMNKKGENLSRDEVRKMIDEVDDNKDGRLDYREFTNMVMKTTEESKKMSKKVMERKERRKKRGELSAAKSDSGNSLEPSNLNTKTGSQMSMQSIKTESVKDLAQKSFSDQADQTDLKGSRSSVRSDMRDLIPPVENTSYMESKGSSLSLKGSTTSYQSKMESDLKLNVGFMGRNDKDPDIAGSKTSIRSAVKDSKPESITGSVAGSKASLKEADELESQVPMKATLKEIVEMEKVTDTSKRRGSASSQRSQTSKQEDIQQSPRKSLVKSNISADSKSPLTPRSLASSKSEPGTSLNREFDKSANKSQSSFKSENVRLEGSSVSSSAAKSESRVPSKRVDFDKLSVKSPRSKLGIPSIRELERPGSSYSTSESSKSKNSTSLLSKTAMESSTGKDSARSVGEEIDPDDDQDIISTGPTPRISLSSRTGSPKTDTPKSAKNGLSKQIKEDKDDNDIGSQSSLRSGDKEAGVPVPSPRKSVTQSVTREDDMPRPSPRVRNSKVKSPSSSLRGKEKLPDPRILQDWYHCTSKGCFFYEEDEIVSHVYSLKLLDDSTVYLCAEPDTDLKCLSNNFGSEPVDTALYVFDSRGSVVAFTEQRDIKGTYGVKLDLAAGVYQILPYTTGCRFKQRKEMPSQVKEAKLVKKDKEDKIRITSAFREALKNIFVLCDLDSNGTMSKEEFNWFNVRTSGEELGDDEWVVVEEKTTLQNGEITVEGFIELNELEAEDAEGDVEDLWITLTSMGMNKALIMDEACPYKLDVYVKEVGRKKPALTVTGIESLEKREFVTEICQYVIDKAGEPTSIRRMKDLYLYTMKNDYRATIVIDNRSRSTVRLQIDCSKSRNVISNREGLDHTFEIDPQQTAIAHHLMPRSELSDWNVTSVETIHK